MIRTSVSKDVREEGANVLDGSKVWERIGEDERRRVCFISIFILIESGRIVN